MSRRLARETCFKLIFEYEFLHDKNEISLQQFLDNENLDEEDKKFIIEEYDGLILHNDEICEIIASKLKGYTLPRIFKIDLAILKIAIYELKFSTAQTPPNVVVNEAVELAKKYSTDKSYSFVNGILASIINGADDAK
jgi:N utilization substance protein B